jgi:hypothetical protein
MDYCIICILRKSRNLARSSFLLLIVAFLLTSLTARYALAHPLGNFSVNRYSRLELSEKTIRVYYIVDMAEIPTLQERGVIDTDRS